MLNGIWIVIKLRSLNYGNIGVRKQSHSAFQEILVGSEIRIQHQYYRRARLRRSDRKSIVQIAGLGVPVIGAGDIARADCFAV